MSSASDQKLKNAINYFIPGSSSTSLVKEAAMDSGVEGISINRSLLPALSIKDLPFDKVTVLDLSKNRLGPHSFNCICYVLASAPGNIKTLNLSHNMAPGECCPAVGALVEKNSKIEVLDLSNNPLTTSLGDSLGKALPSNKTLKELNLAAVGLVDATTLFAGMGGHCLEKLNVSSNACAKGSWSKLGSAMAAGLGLKSLKAKGAAIGDDGASSLSGGIRSQKAIVEIDLSNTQLGSSGLSEILEVLSGCKNVASVNLSDNQCKDGGGRVGSSLGAVCKAVTLDLLDLSGCALSPQVASSVLESVGGGKGVKEFSLSANNLPEETSLKLKTTLFKMHQAGKRVEVVGYARNSVEKLFYMDVMADDFDDAEALPAWLPDSLDISDSKASAEVLEQIDQKFGEDDCPLKVLRMEGVPLGKPPGQGRVPRGQPASPPLIAKLCKELEAKVKRKSLVSLKGVYLHNCSLKDLGATFLGDLLKAGWKVEDLDLGLNEIGDSGSSAIAEGLSTPGNMVERLQLRINACKNDGAKKIASALFSPDCKLKILGLSSNRIGTQGLKAVMEAVEQSKTLQLLELDQQKEAVWNEDDFAGGAKKLAEGLKSRPLDSPGLQINLQGIEGMGMASSACDCGAVESEYGAKQKITTLGFQDCLDIAEAIKQTLTPQEFEQMVGGFGSTPGNSPSWLLDPSLRQKAVYIAHLQLSITKDRLEDFFESEADANVQELVMCQDKAMKTPNGFAWVLFKDSKSVEKSIEIYHKGLAAIYGGPFIISAVAPILSDDGSAGKDIAGEMEARAAAEAQRKAEEKANVDALHQQSMDKQKNQKAAYGGSDMGVSHANTLGGQNLDGKGYSRDYDPGKPW